MSRRDRYCKRPGACAAPQRGPCKVCQPQAFERVARNCTRVEVPAWVPASLQDEYREHARLTCEEDAASHIRKLKRAMEANCR